MAGGLVAVLGEHGEHRRGALGGAAAGEQGGGDAMAAQRVGHPPRPGARAIGEDLRLSGVGLALGHDGEHLADALAGGVAVHHLKLGALLDIDTTETARRAPFGQTMSGQRPP
jgi:hypothetical protein